MPISPSNKPIVALTMGDPAGIGPEIIVKALAKSPIRRLANYVIVGDITTLEKSAISLNRHHKLLIERLQVISLHPPTPLDSKSRCMDNTRASKHLTEPRFKKKLFASYNKHITLLDLKNVPVGSFSFGGEKAAHGKASVEYITRAYDLVRANIVDCVVTAPINKSAVRMSGFRFPGHTEYFASLAGAKKFVMMLVGGPLRVSLVTRHIAISKVPSTLTSQGIADTIKITSNALRADFNISRPRIGVCALNPHSGEAGMFGKEEIKIIAPTIRRFRKNVVGPIAADALFYDAYRGKFDGIICLYHDQGLIPLKMIARDSGVNVTLGLGFVRTSPDHGTAFDIAGEGKADSRSMEAAIKLAVSMAVNRKKLSKYKE